MLPRPTAAEDYQADVLDGLTQGLQGQQGVTKPAAWDAFARQAGASTNAALTDKVDALDVALGSAGALDQAREESRSTAPRRHERARPRSSR